MSARIALLAGVSVAYLLLSQWLMTSAPPSPWNAVGILSPMLGAAALAAWQAGQHVRGVLAGGAVAGLCAAAVLGIKVPEQWLYLAQHVVIHLMLAMWFASTLREGRQPLISGLAEKVHGSLAPTMKAYTENLTRAWVIYFMTMVAGSIGLFVLTPFEVWASFANLVTPLALVAMFVGERLLRYRLHPEFKRSTMMDAIRAYMQSTAAQPVPPRDVS